MNFSLVLPHLLRDRNRKSSSVGSSAKVHSRLGKRLVAEPNLQLGLGTHRRPTCTDQSCGGGCESSSHLARAIVPIFSATAMSDFNLKSAMQQLPPSGPYSTDSVPPSRWIVPIVPSSVQRDQPAGFAIRDCHGPEGNKMARKVTSCRSTWKRLTRTPSSPQHRPQARYSTPRRRARVFMASRISD